MNTVTIERNHGEPEDCVYAPMDSKKRDGKLSFYLETKKGWRVVTLEVVRPYRGFFVNDVGRELDTPFPDSPPKGISACQLLPPPCYESEDDAKKCLPENYPEWFPHIPEHKLEWGTIFQQIHEEALWVKPEHEKKGSSTFSVGDIKKLQAFVTKLKQPANAISKYLNGKLPQSTRQQLADFGNSNSNDATVGVSLIDLLNIIIQGPSIYDTNRFKDVALRPGTRRMLDGNPQGDALVRLNRLLLEDAYPLELPKKGSLLRNGLAKLRWEARDKRRLEVEAKVKAYKKAYGVEPEAGHEQNTQDELRLEANLQLEACKRHWKTLEALSWEDFKRGCRTGEEDSPRDQFLVGEWAKRNSINLTRMAKDRKVCEAWLKETCRNARAFVRDVRYGFKRDFVEEILHFEGNEEESIKALLVRVRYKVMFEDGTLLFLTACEERSLRASEQAEVGGLRPIYEETDEGRNRALQKLFQEMKPEEVDKEIIRLFESENLSQDKIVKELRKQKRGKRKSYVGKVIKEYNHRLSTMGLNIKRTVTGPGLRDEEDDETPYSKLEETEIKGILDKWDDTSDEQKLQLEQEYPEVKAKILRKHYDNFGTYPEDKRKKLLARYPELKKAFKKVPKPPS